MAEVKIGKPEAAQRQIDAAVRMLFSGEDVVACAGLAGAAYRIVRDLAEAAGTSNTHNVMKLIIRPGMEREFWAAMNKVPNFLKHADKDADEILEFDDELVDLNLFHASVIYRELGFKATREMIAIQTLVVANNPNLMTFPPDGQRVMQEVTRGLEGLSRADKLAVGQRLLTL